MTEAYVGFLCKIAFNINQSDNPAHNILRSHYFMKCKTTGGNGLPAKNFSSAVRCPKCCLEWTKERTVTLKPNPLSKRQRKRLKSRKSKMKKRKSEYTERKLNGNVLEQTCTFCHHTTAINIEKPKVDFKGKIDSKRQIIDEIKKDNDEGKNNNHTIKEKLKEKKVNYNINKVRENNKTNVYTNAFDIFSLNNEKNTLKSAVKEPPKIIKNSKRKKDKYAGLCQKAVLASAKLKEEKVKQNKLNLFLKPSADNS